MPNNLHNRIKSRRMELGLSQDALAKACNVGQSTVANWERGGHIPRPAKISKIAQALGINDIWLISGEHGTNEGPVNRYLNTPIRHVPVYDWPLNLKIFNSTRPNGYVTMTIEPENTFSVIAPEEGTSFKSGTMLMFTQDYDDNESGIYLILTEKTASLETLDQPQPSAIGRLIFSQTSH